MASVSLALVGALVLGACTSSVAAGDAPRSGSASSQGGRLGASAARLEREIFELVNRHRAARGLPTLVLDPRISREARNHSAAMATGSRSFGHDGFAARMAALRRVMSYDSGAENIASSLGYLDPAPDVLRGWLASRGHRGNMEGPYDVTGIGVARSASGKVYFTQIFVGR